MNRIPMTREGYEQALAKLKQLKEVEMPRIEKALGDAREMGDLSENAEFDTARSEMWNLEQQIGELESKLALADVIDSSQSARQGVVAIGATLKVEEVGSGRHEEFMLVGEGEMRSDVDTVSVTSPLGQAFLGKGKGDMAEVEAPRGRIRYKIIEFRYA